jgi:hypothetical protein
VVLCTSTARRWIEREFRVSEICAHKRYESLTCPTTIRACTASRTVKGNMETAEKNYTTVYRPDGSIHKLPSPLTCENFLRRIPRTKTELEIPARRFRKRSFLRVQSPLTLRHLIYLRRRASKGTCYKDSYSGIIDVMLSQCRFSSWPCSHHLTTTHQP